MIIIPVVEKDWGERDWGERDVRVDIINIEGDVIMEEWVSIGLDNSVGASVMFKIPDG